MRESIHRWYGIPVAEPEEPPAGSRSGSANEREPPAGADGESLADAFWGVARQLRRLSRESLGPIEITPGQSRALRILDRDGPIRLNALADQLRIAPRSTTEVVDGLEERGLVERRPDVNDRRATLVALTAEGMRIAGVIHAAAHAEAERLFGCLSPSDRAALARILRELRR
jgi:DNA-binding MarR family transcriptional regulator